MTPSIMDADVKHGAADEEFRGTVLDNPYIGQRPTPKQAIFLLHNGVREVLFGGCAGRSSALLDGRREFVDVPGYSAIVFRNTEGQLLQANGLVERSRTWWKAKARNSTAMNCHGRSRAAPKIRFDFMEHDEHAFRHRGSEYQCVAEGTPVLMGDGSYRAVERVKVGDECRRWKAALGPPGSGGQVESGASKRRRAPDGRLLGKQVHPQDHPASHAGGWVSYAWICDRREAVLFADRFRQVRHKFRRLLELSVNSQSDRPPPVGHVQSWLGSSGSAPRSPFLQEAAEPKSKRVVVHAQEFRRLQSRLPL